MYVYVCICMHVYIYVSYIYYDIYNNNNICTSMYILYIYTIIYNNNINEYIYIYMYINKCVRGERGVICVCMCVGVEI